MLYIKDWLPGWMRTYQKADFPFDLVAGLTVGVLMIPQGMAYAMLAGLPPVYGLYAATVPMIVYACLGSSRHLSVGPVAIDSILTAAGVRVLATVGSADYISLTITLALMVGLIQFGLGVSRLGFLINFLSHPVVVGFSSAAAIIIGVSQLKPLLGINIPSSLYLHHIIASVIASGFNIHVITAVIGIGGIAVLILLKRHLPSLPAPLLFVALATVIT
ncbi:MAG: SulP family inorganic anion transporter, partial [Bacteroidota bacterium]|nr:SulP family inorganic anion transporter [Bacteroidota bacterium]